MYVLPDKWQVSHRNSVVVAKSVYVFELLSEKTSSCGQTNSLENVEKKTL